MALALRKASKLKPEIRLAQAVSHFEADLSPQQKTELHAYRQQMLENPPDPSDVMRLTAQVDRLASRKGCRRCFGPRFTNFLQAVQQFAALGDVIVGGSQNIIACGIWSLLLVNFSSYLEKLSSLLMVAGRSAPRHQSIAVLYPRSTHLQSHLFEYYIVVVSLCHKLLKFTQRSTVGQLTVGLGSLDINTYQAELEQWANAIKEEISILMAERIEGEAQENRRFRALSTKISASASQLQRWKINQRVLASLSIHDSEKIWKQTRKVGNTTLFTRNTAYQDWKGRGDSCTLVYTGNLGSGKSVLLANMVDDLNLHNQDKATRVAYFFARYDTPNSLEARTIIGSLAWQFLRNIPDLDLTSTAESLDMTRPILDMEGIFNLLQHALPADFKAYVILDGIDDCDDAERVELIQHLHKLQVTFKLLLCISHRVESNSLLKHYLEKLTAATSTSIPDKNPDIEDFIEAELESCIKSRKLSLGDPRLILDIRDALQTGSKGMFLWTALQIDSLCYMKTDDTIRQALRDFPKDLSETFSRILHRSRELGEPYQKRILELVTAAQRPLTAEELREALSVVPGDATWNPAKALNDVFSVLTCCGSLLIKDEEDFTIRFVHHSVKQFLLDGGKASEAAITTHGAKRTMSEIVITYLNYGIFDTQISTGHSSQVMSQSAMPKIIHSALGSSSTVSNLALQFLKSRKQPNFDMNKVLRDTREEALGTNSIYQHHFRSYTRLYWVQHILDLSDSDPVMYRLLLRLLRGNEVDVNATDDFGRTPLSLAAEIGNEIVVRILLESGKADVEAEDKYRETPLLWAASMGHKTVVKLLVETRKADIESKDMDGLTPLSWAARNGHEAVVKLLVETSKAEVESRDEEGLTPLSWAARNGHEAVVQLLVEKGKAEVESKDAYGYTPLSWAARNGHEAVVQLLVEKGKAEVESKDAYRQTPLSWAARKGHEAVVQLLVEKGKAEVESKDKYGQTPLSWAAGNGHEAVVKLLLKTGKADIESKDNYGQTPLSWAVRNGYETVVKLLLKTGKVDVESKDKYGRTPLSWAASYGHETVVKLLLETGKVDAKPENYQTALSLARENGHKGIVTLLESYSQK
ncbi:hypothetical protein JMJ35_005037 [Cladonia borealis]|uniref:NACHT domain-containing protein n=1 Tax=Cladonia borealis TaxID=184061 RepID=A0AA39R3D1_9LECA|nr:hypothetical protein JMJ35_005037 [Cladonia borealis]